MIREFCNFARVRRVCPTVTVPSIHGKSSKPLLLRTRCSSLLVDQRNGIYARVGTGRNAVNSSHSSSLSWPRRLSSVVEQQPFAKDCTERVGRPRHAILRSRLAHPENGYSVLQIARENFMKVLNPHGVKLLGSFESSFSVYFSQDFHSFTVSVCGQKFRGINNVPVCMSHDCGSVYNCKKIRRKTPCR